MSTEVQNDYPHEATPYPFRKFYGWEGPLRWTFKEMTDFLKKMLRQGGSGARQAAIRATIKAVEDIYATGKVERFTGDKVKALLVLAADECQWYIPRPARKPAVAPTETHKECAKCKQVKPLEVFRAVATARQKAYYGWGADSKRILTSKLCDVCRAAKTKREQYLVKKRQTRALLAKKTAAAQPTVHLVARYADSIQRHMNRVNTTFSKHRVTLQTPDGPTSFLQFKSEDDQRFFDEKLRYLKQARQRLDAAVGAGTVAQLPDSGAWDDLLTPHEREYLLHLWQQGSWAAPSNRRKNAPHLFHARSRPIETPAEQVRTQQEHSSPPDRARTASTATNWEDF